MKPNMLHLNTQAGGRRDSFQMYGMTIFLSAFLFLGLGACSDRNPKINGDDQIQAPVLNSGPETEAERAKDQARDSSWQGADSMAIGKPR